MGLTVDLLEDLLTVNDPVLSQEVVRTLSSQPILSQTVLTRIATDTDRDPQLRCEAIAGLAAMVESVQGTLLELVNDDEQSVREEALRSLRGGAKSPELMLVLGELAKQHPSSEDLIGAVLDHTEMLHQRPPATETKAWLQLLDQVNAPVDRVAGERIFQHAKLAQCLNCHRHSGRGNVVGPDLTNISRGKDREWLLRSILEPSREMAPEYQPRTVLFRDGTVFTGIRLRSWTKEAMRDANGRTRTFELDEIESMQDSVVSFMPTELTNSLTLRELRDLLAFLEGEPIERVPTGK